MLVVDDRIHRAELQAAIDAQFAPAGGPRPALEFAPLGEDSWSFRYGRYWVSVRRDRQGHVPAAYEAAHALASAGCDFVLAPLAGRDARVVRTVGEFPVVVFPFVAGATPLSRGAGPGRAEADAVLAMLTSVYDTSLVIDLPSERFQFPFDDELSSAIERSARRVVESGPYGARLQRLLAERRSYIEELRAEAAQVARSCASSAGRLVLTHGEPSAANVLRAGDRLLLADWGTALWGPPERDTYHVRRTFGARVDGRPEFFRFYELRWILGEIAEYATRFFGPHSGDDDDAAMWGRLMRYLGEGVDARRPMAQS